MISTSIRDEFGDCVPSNESAYVVRVCLPIDVLLSLVVFYVADLYLVFFIIMMSHGLVPAVLTSNCTYFVSLIEQVNFRFHLLSWECG